MKYGTRTGSVAKAKTQCTIVGVYETGDLTPSAQNLDEASSGYLKKVLSRGDIAGKANQVQILHDVPNIGATRVMLIGLGKAKSMDATRFAGIAKAASNNLKTLAAKQVLCCLTEVDIEDHNIAWRTEKLIEALSATFYSFTNFKGKTPQKSSTTESVDFVASSRSTKRQIESSIHNASALSKGIAEAKDLGNTPGNICTPTFLAKRARQLAKQYGTLSTTVIDEKEIEKLGMGAFMSVSRGSVQPGKLIIMKHNGGKPKAKPHILVGKGITFDTGGISLKPGAGMHEMIYDMCGAASVFGTMVAIVEQELPLNVVGVVAAAENMPSGKASRPGDIVKTMSGQTVEILNTDAEGRLVLCDALTYIEKYKPETVIDIATLTGACIVALGSHASALYANDDNLAENITSAGESALDRVWRMPLWEDYQAQLNSAFADMANIGGREAGSITAACFLARFAKKFRWAHLDVAGTAFKGSGPAKGSPGRPVPLLFKYLNDRANKA